jgi:hypothetical protein
MIGDLAAHANFNGFSLLLQKLLCQQRRAKPGMEHSKNLKADAVVAAEKHRQDGSPCSARQSHSRVIPFRICDPCLGNLQVRYFAGRKNRHHSSALKPH